MAGGQKWCALRGRHVTRYQVSWFLFAAFRLNRRLLWFRKERVLFWCHQHTLSAKILHHLSPHLEMKSRRVRTFSCFWLCPHLSAHSRCKMFAERLNLWDPRIWRTSCQHYGISTTSQEVLGVKDRVYHHCFYRVWKPAGEIICTEEGP